MSEPAPGCRRLRDAILDQMMAGMDEGGLTPAVRRHLSDCPACRAYYRGMRLATGKRPEDSLFTPDLRRRTLDAVERAGRSHPYWLTPLLVPLSALSVAATLIVPSWILMRLVRHLFGSEWISLALAVTVTSITGAVIMATGLILLARFANGSPGSTGIGDFIREVHHG